MKIPLVSICIPTYKQIQYLHKCLNSVLEQDFTDYELIISDDTPDESVKTFVYDILKDRPFKYISNIPALGSPANSNNAVAVANGKYIYILHHDDCFLQPNSLSLMVDQIQKASVDFLFCETKVWYPETNCSRIHTISDRQLESLENRIDTLFFNNWIGSPSVTLFRNDPTIVFDERLVWLVDVDFYMNYIKKHGSFVFLKDALICTAHGMTDQITTKVENDRSIRVKEPVLVFLKDYKESIFCNDYKVFFAGLFKRYNVNSYEELIGIISEAAEEEYYFQQFFVIEMSVSGICTYLWRKLKGFFTRLKIG